ncbi:hypothetical protein D3C85_1947240 [compost metagenome]
MGMGRPILTPNGPVSLTVPTGTCQAICWVFRSTAVSVPNGGFWQGISIGDMKRTLALIA